MLVCYFHLSSFQINCYKTSSSGLVPAGGEERRGGSGPGGEGEGLGYAALVPAEEEGVAARPDTDASERTERTGPCLRVKLRRTWREKQEERRQFL